MVASAETRWRDHYDWRAREYASEAQASAYSRAGFAGRMQTLSHLLQRLPLSLHARVLDVGCASGAAVRALERAGHRAVGLDYATAQLARARAADPGGAYVAGDAYALPFHDDTFDLVICMGVLPLLTRPAAVIAEAQRVLHASGVVVVEASNGAALAVRLLQLRDGLRRRSLSPARYSPPSVRHRLTQAGFADVWTQGLYLVPAWATALQRWLERHEVGRALDRVPALGDRLAHSVFYVATKPGPAPAGEERSGALTSRRRSR